MKRIVHSLSLISLLLSLSVIVQADITNIIGGISCGNPGCPPTGAVPVLQGRKTVLLIDGQDVNFADKNNVDVTGSGVTARIIKDHLVSPKFGVGTGRAEVELDLSADATPGERTVTLNHNGCFGCPRKYKFKILIVRNGKITDVDVPSPTQFFHQVNITLTGQRIGNAGVNLLGFPGGTTAQVLSSQSDETRAVVRLNFNSMRAEAKGKIQLFDKACGTCLVNREVYDGLTNSQVTEVSMIGPNAVKDITFPDGVAVRVGGLLTIQINLVRPARRGVRFPVGGFVGVNPRGGVSQAGPDGEVVHWQLVPSNVFEAGPGSDTVFSPTGLNEVRIPGGDMLVRLTVRLKQAPSGCPESGCSAEVQTRMGNLNTDQPPFFKTARFTILPPAQ
jgi:hypothetical protein